MPEQTPRFYAIGDIHGRLDLLDRAVAAIERDMARYGGWAMTVTLGDYIDRGPDSRGVIERLSLNPFPTDYVAIKGNHEDMLEDFLDRPETGAHWRMQGGAETLQAYGVAVRGLLIGRANIEAAERLGEALPDHHITFFNGLHTSFSCGPFYFCHAGVRPGVPLEQQRDQDLMWIREGFLQDESDHGKLIVHGHTPVPSPEIHPNRINIDTGAVTTGRLTCIVLDEGGYRFLEV